MKSFTTLRNLAGSLSQNTSTTNLTLFDQLLNDSHKYLLQKYFYNEASVTISTVSQQQFYDLPFDFSKNKTDTITTGDLKWTPNEVLSRQDWDRLNVFPYYADFPSNYFIWNNKQLGFWPIPSTGSTESTYTGLVGTLTDGDTITVGSVTGTIISSDSTTMVIAIPASAYGVALGTGAFTTSGGASGTISANTVTAGNTITYNYKRRPTDLTFADYTTGTVTATVDSTTITGSGTGFVANYLPSAGSVLTLNLWIKITPPSGDGNWYQISSLDSATQLTLVNTYKGGTTSGASFIIGQMPLLLEDFHDLLVYRPLMIYFSTIVDNPNKKKEFTDLYNAGIQSLDEYAGSKTVNVNLRQAINTRNPNAYQSSVGGAP